MARKIPVMAKNSEEVSFVFTQQACSTHNPGDF